jgi:5-formyltetrahydrofolate cyclo-ligase
MVESELVSDDSRRRSDLRSQIRSARRALDPAVRRASDQRIQQRTFEVLAARSPGLAALSMPTDGEADIATLAPALRSAGWTIALPVVGTGDEPTLDFVVWEDGAELLANRFGIPEPAVGESVPVGDLDVVVVPAVAVDTEGHRLGFGAGFYDRALAERRADSLLVAAVHDAQFVDHVPADDHDVHVHVVVTPERTIWVDATGT